jgi:hypothetical protein
MRVRHELGFYLNALGLLGVGIEVGVFRGDFALKILETWHGKSLILVDPWRHLLDYRDSWNLSDSEMEKNLRLTLAKLDTHKSRVNVLRMCSEEAVPLIDDASCDFIYLDANHSYKATKRDLVLWFPKLRMGGLMCGHDYFDAKADERLEPIFGSRSFPLRKVDLTSYGVKSAVDEFAERIGAHVVATEEKFPTWYFLKQKYISDD